MRRMFRRRPSASMAVSITALIFALTGTAAAAGGLLDGHKFNGDKLIKKDSLSGDRLQYHTLTARQVDVSRLGKVPSATKADRSGYANHAAWADNAGLADIATTAKNALNANHASNADNAASVTGITRFRTTIQPSGSSFADANTVTLGTSGPLGLIGKCFSSGGTTTGAFFLRTTQAAHYNAYSRTSSAVLTPGTDQDVAEFDASSAAGTIDYQNPYDGTFSAMTDTGSAYITGMASVATNLNGATACTFAGFTESV